MKNVDFEVSEDLFRSKPTEDSYLLSALKNENGNFDIVYIDISDDGEISLDKSEVYDNKKNRNIIEKEKFDTYMKVIDINDWYYANAIYDMDRKMYDVLFSKNMEGILSLLGLSSSFIVGKGLSLVQIDRTSSFIYIFVGGILMVLSLRAAFNYFQHKDEFKYLKEQKENLILDRVNKLVRKK